MNKWKCPVCGKEVEYFGFEEWVKFPKTTLFGTFKVRDVNGNIQIVDRLSYKPVCSEQCKSENENQYFVEEYKGQKIYCVDGKYMPYLECDYCYDSVEGVKNRIDNPNLIPITPGLMNGLVNAMSGELGSI